MNTLGCTQNESKEGNHSEENEVERGKSIMI